MPYGLPQYVSPCSQDGDRFAPSTSSDSKSISPSHHQSLFGPLGYQDIQQQQQQPLLSPFVSTKSSISSSSSLPSPVLSSSSLSSSSLLPRSVSPLPPSNIYSFVSSSSSPPPRIGHFAYNNNSDERSNSNDRMLMRKEAEDGDAYPLDLSLRSTNRTSEEAREGESLYENSQQRPLVSRPRPLSRADPRYKQMCSSHVNSNSHIVSSSSGPRSARAQQRVSPYPVPQMAGGTRLSSSPSALPCRSPVPLRTDSPIYGRRRTPSPAYYSGLMPDGSFRTNNAVNGSIPHPHLPHSHPYIAPAPAAPHHMLSSTSPVVQPESSSSPSPFQILTTSDTVLHGTPIVSGLFRPYQDQMDSDMNSNGQERQAHAEDQAHDRHHQHQNHDPRRQHLRQLQQQQQQQEEEQQQTHLHGHQQNVDEEEERTYMDLDCHSQATYPRRDKQGNTLRTSGVLQVKPDGAETAMDVTNQTNSASDTSVLSPVLNRQISMGFDERSNLIPDRKAIPCDQKSELTQNREGHHFLRKAFLAANNHQQKDLKGGQTEAVLMQSDTPHHPRPLGEKQEQQGIEPNHFQHGQQQPQQSHHHQRQIKPLMTVSTSQINGGDAEDKNTNSKNRSQEVLEEAKLMAFLSKTTLFTLKQEKDINSAGSAGVQSLYSPQKRYPVGINIFKDANGADIENVGSGIMPKIDFCLPQAARAGTSSSSSSCKNSLIAAPNKICFRLVDLVGILVEQSLRA
ncbi:hypothetical protein PoB_001133000 [Plakobranchus ocellatus]|uniref:Uncharacterized protein n=1 Tax=Plakobranchus ocellatus TaxID=259542 RepID=A0AAV3YQ34_9GAST|nr:hypothetical protein PoB_001133000 [Plakobranchus ocellatus]